MTTNAAALRTKAAQHEQDAADSFDRCDTDGFLSQWASGINARLCRAQAELADAGNRSEFAALFDTDGNLVAAKLVNTRFGLSWGILPDDNPHGRFVAWFNPSKASTAAKRQAADARKGYQVGRVRTAAKAEIAGSGTGLSGALSCYIAVKRADGGFSRDVEIVSTSHYDD